MQRIRFTPAVFAAVFALSGFPFHSALSDTWRSELYPASWTPPTVDSVDFRSDKIIQDFSYAGYKRGEQEIPRVEGPVFNVLEAPYHADPTGDSDSTAAIQAAIDAADSAGGGVVLLPAGAYRIAPAGSNSFALRIQGSDIVLRGEGAGKTFLLNTETRMRGREILSILNPGPGNWRGGGSHSTPLTRDLPGPATEIPVESTEEFSQGDWIVIRNTVGNAWIHEHKEDEWLDHGSSLGGQTYFRQLTAVDPDAGTLSVDIPTRYYLKTRDEARVELHAAPLQQIGLEDFSIGNVQHPANDGWGEEDYRDSDNAAYDTHASYAITFQGVANSWMLRVESFQAPGNTSTCHILSNGVRLSNSRSVTIKECHFQRSQFGGGGGNGYMYRLQNASDNLVVDSKATFSRHGFVFGSMGASGNVLLRCHDKDTGRSTGNTGSYVTNGSGSDHHMHFSHSNLIDSCIAENSYFTAHYRPWGGNVKHNLTAAHSVFWNTMGKGDPGYTRGGGNTIVRSQQSRYGYIIGTSGNRHGASTPAFEKTDPVDHQEGIGKGDTLAPQSLYLDQLKKRMSH